jgi:hypothetical protein
MAVDASKNWQEVNDAGVALTRRMRMLPCKPLQRAAAYCRGLRLRKARIDENCLLI